MVPVVKLNDISLESQYNFLFKDFLKIVDIDLEVARLGAIIRSNYNLRTPDALQIACALYYHCDEFVTADSSLKRINEIKITLIG